MAPIIRFTFGPSLARRSLAVSRMKNKPNAQRPTKRAEQPQQIAEASARRGVPEEDLQGPVAAETAVVGTAVERQVEEETRRYSSISPTLSGGDLDADWQ